MGPARHRDIPRYPSRGTRRASRAVLPRRGGLREAPCDVPDGGVVSNGRRSRRHVLRGGATHSGDDRRDRRDRRRPRVVGPRNSTVARRSPTIQTADRRSAGLGARPSVRSSGSRGPLLGLATVPTVALPPFPGLVRGHMPATPCRSSVQDARGVSRPPRLGTMSRDVSMSRTRNEWPFRGETSGPREIPPSSMLSQTGRTDAYPNGDQDSSGSRGRWVCFVGEPRSS